MDVSVYARTKPGLCQNGSLHSSLIIFFPDATEEKEVCERIYVEAVASGKVVPRTFFDPSS